MLPHTLVALQWTVQHTQMLSLNTLIVSSQSLLPNSCLCICSHNSHTVLRDVKALMKSQQMVVLK